MGATYFVYDGDSVWKQLPWPMLDGSVLTDRWQVLGPGGAVWQNYPPSGGPTRDYIMKVTSGVGAWTITQWNRIDTYGSNGFEGEIKLGSGPFHCFDGVVADFSLVMEKYQNNPSDGY